MDINLEYNTNFRYKKIKNTEYKNTLLILELVANTLLWRL